MFYYEKLNGKEILRSSCLEGINHFFTTRDVNISDIVSPDLRIVTPKQTHTDNIEIVDIRNDYPDTDALILTERNTVIYLRFADCTPIMLYDSANKTAAIAHAGWKGTAKKIGPKTVQKMIKMYGTNPADVIAVIGPAIGLCCYETGKEVKEQLLSTVQHTKDLFKNKNVDLKGINAQQLREIGVKNIDICPYCTSCNNDKFYSYRKEHGTDKRHYAAICL